jgi:hypothetical protein
MSSQFDKEDTASAKSFSGASLDDALKEIHAMLRQRENDLEERERQLEKQTTTSEQANLTPLGKPSDVLRLNVAGTTMDILRRTLTSVEGSVLAAQFSGRWDDSLAKDRDGNFFINQPYELWRPMVEYLLDKECETPLTAGVSSPTFTCRWTRKRFYRMVEYYEMTLGVYPFVVCKVLSPIGRGPPVGCHPDYSIVNPHTFASFGIAPDNDSHDRSISSFEVTLGDFTSATIGWSVGDIGDLYVEYAEGRGVGYASDSIAFDCSTSSVVFRSPATSPDCVSTHIPGCPLSAGSVIRCEDAGNKWYVNGKLVATTNEQTDGVRFVADWTIPVDPKVSIRTLIPYISIQGSCKVSKIELLFPQPK